LRITETRSACVIVAIMPKAVFNLSRKNDWETPPDLFKVGCDYFGISPLLDVCATAQNSLCKYHYDHDALNRPFDMPFWCNPPFSELKKWIRKCYLEHVKHNVSGLMLTFAKTDTHAFHDYVFSKESVSLLFIRGRVHFYDKGIRSKNPSPYASCFIFFREKMDV